MIHAAFFVKNGRQAGFTVSGHSGLADPGADILCAAVSAMTMLVVNTLQGGFPTAPARVRSGDIRSPSDGAAVAASPRRF